MRFEDEKEKAGGIRFLQIAQTTCSLIALLFLSSTGTPRPRQKKKKACCLGTMTWGGKQNDAKDAHDQLSYAFDRGVNWFDTAEIYAFPPSKETSGNTDRCIAPWLAKQDRTKIIVATKVAGFGNDYLRKGGEITRITKAQVKESVEGSLKRLGTDFIDLLQIHWPDRHVPLFGTGPYHPENIREGDIPFEEQLEALNAVVREGKVRHIGVSNETSWGVTRFLLEAEKSGGPKIVSIQNSYSLLVRGAYETDLAETCAPLNGDVALLAYSPLARGVLSGKYIKPGGAPKASRLNLFEGYMDRYNKSLAREAVGKYCEVAEKHGLTPTQLALGWCTGRWQVTSSIIGATTTEQLKENLDAFDVVLSEDCLKDIEKVHQRYRDPMTRPIE